MPRFVLAPLALAAATFTPCLAHAQGHVLRVGSDGLNDCGGTWLFDLKSDGTLDSELELSDLAGNFTGVLANGDGFGAALAPLGDLDGNGTPDLAVGAPGDDGGGTNRGAVWILFRAADGSVLAHVPLRPGGAFAGTLVPAGARFGSALANLGDLDGDGSLELAVGTSEDTTTGSVWMLSLEPDGSVSRELVLGPSLGGFGGTLNVADHFGGSLASLGDLDVDGVTDLAVGAFGDNDGNAGAIWVLFLNADGTVASQQKISKTSGGFGGALSGGDSFGTAIANLGDMNADGVTDLAVGASGDDDGAANAGAVWILRMTAAGTVVSQQLISRTAGGLGGHTSRAFGSSLAPLGDVNADGVPDVIVGAPTGASLDTGNVFVLFLNSDGTVQTRLRYALPGAAPNDSLGVGLARLGDWDFDGRVDVAVGATAREGAPSNGGHYRSVQAAIDWAAAGDTILVGDGTYDGAGIDAKPLTLLAENRGQAVMSALSISTLGPSQSVQVSGFQISGYFESMIDLSNNQGTVWVEDCTTSVPAFSFVEAPGIEVDACADVVLSRSQFTATSTLSTSPLNFQPAAAGLDVKNGSSVHAFDCLFMGGIGERGSCGDYCYFARAGGPGVRTRSASDFLFLSGSTAQGGIGLSYVTCSSGGTGLMSTGTTEVLDSSLVGGTSPCGGATGAASSGTIGLLPGAHLSMSVANPTHEIQGTPFTFDGPPSTGVFVLYALRPKSHFRPGLGGTDVLGTFRYLEYFGQTDTTGHLEIVRHLGVLPPGYEILHLYAQSLYIHPASTSVPFRTGTGTVRPHRIQLGAPSTIQRLDAGF
jgi:hypothetical protein